MRPLVGVVISCLLLAVALPQLARAPIAGQTTLVVERRYDPSRIVIEPGPSGAVISWSDHPSLEQEGRPALPVDRVTVLAPRGMRLVEVRTHRSGERRLPLPGPPAPYRAKQPEPVGEVSLDAEVYDSRAPYPEADREILPGGYMRGRRVETVEVRPIRYLPDENSLAAVERIDLEFVFGPDHEERLTPREVSWEPTDRFLAAGERAAHAVAGSPARAVRAPVEMLVDGSEPFSPRFLPSEEGSPVRYLIITTTEMEPAFQRLADWKIALGVPAVVRSTQWISDNYPPGVDTAAEIRGFIREAVELWGVEYVMLGGDFLEVPPRFGKSYFFGGEDIPTDLYMSCLDGNWNTDGDDLFGEAYFNTLFPGDGADLYPDVWVGRAPVRTAAEAQSYIDKIIGYETLVPLGSSFAEKSLILGEMLFPQNWTQGDTVVFDGAQVCETAVALLPPNIVPYRMYENHLGYPGSVFEVKQDVITEIDSGYNFTLHVGHGFRNTMAVGAGGETLFNTDADGFVNGPRQGLLYAINCTSSAFDFDCIAEHFLRNPAGGVVSSIGSTRLDFPATGWDYQNEFFDLVYGQGVTKVGEAAALQKLPFIPSSGGDGEHRWTQFTMTYMGDPDMDLYTGPVDTVSVTLLEPMELGQSSFTALVTNSSGPVEGAVVCLSKSGDAYGFAVTAANGTAQVPFQPDLPGMASLGVRAHNHLSRVDSVLVTPPSGLHVYTADLGIDDVSGGDGNGQLSAGETALLTPILGNQGQSPAIGVTITILQAPPGITVNDATAFCPGILSGSIAVCTDPLEIVLDPTISDLSVFTLTVRLETAGYTRDEPIVLYAGGPDVVHETTTVDDSTGNGNGNLVVEAGEDQNLLLFLSNRGLGPSTALTATLSSADPAVTILDGVSSYGDLASGATQEGDGFLFRFSDTDLTHLFQLSLSDQRGVFLTKALAIDPPAATTGLVATGRATSIDLVWTPPSTLDLAGYNVYRAVSGSGPFSRVNPVRTDRVTYYRDEGLPPLTRFFYTVAAVDSSGMEGAMSDVAEATTSLSTHGDFPLDVGAATASAPCLGYLTNEHEPQLMTGGQELYVVRHDGKEFLDGDGNAQSLGVFSDTDLGPFWCPPSVADIDDDGEQEIVCASWLDGWLHVWDPQGQVQPGWPKKLNLNGPQAVSAWGAAALADVDSDGDMEIFINVGSYTFAFHHDGTELLDGDSDPLTDGVFLVMGTAFNYSTPAIADVDNDLQPEIIVTSRDGKLYVMRPDGSSLPGFPYDSGSEITNSPAIGDLDNDGLKEIVFAPENLLAEARNVNLVQPPGWPVDANMNRDFDASPALADMDGDGFLDVILCAGNGFVYMYHGQNGQLFPGWGFVLLDGNGQQVGLSSSPAVGNLDQDPDLEVCFGANDSKLYAFNIDGSPVDGFPILTANRIEGGPLLWDIDNDGFTEVVAHSIDERLYVWKSPGVFDPSNQPWPMFHHDTRRTGDVGGAVVIAVPETRTPPPSLVLAPNYPNPFSTRTTITFRVPDEATSGVDVDLSVIDVAGRRVATLLHQREFPGVRTLIWDGSAADGARVSAGVYFYRLRAGEQFWTRKLLLLP